MPTDELNPYEPTKADSSPVDRIPPTLGWRVIALVFFALGLAVTSLGATVFTLTLTSERGIFNYENELPEVLVVTVLGVAWLIVARLIWRNHRHRKPLAIVFGILIPILIAFSI